MGALLVGREMYWLNKNEQNINKSSKVFRCGACVMFMNSLANSKWCTRLSGMEIDED